MTGGEKSQLAGWIVVAAIVAVLAVGVFYANRNIENDLTNVEPAAGTSAAEDVGNTDKSLNYDNPPMPEMTPDADNTPTDDTTR